ncbi:hypothetical protein PISMIDRAFT_17667 [Pisolithus microcarpus 441]|uniref:Reverse transcriptase Ty1/copia-type domain-containing protein n=1 Tax=Pisolithus microcarpus 441 TaxID=765257 RepID=A0A0C9XN94_9AGAM|nr:hypothetical protein PISMIDRAFT_17667 [Pisolithus microcarpus 441]
MSTNGGKQLANHQDLALCQEGGADLANFLLNKVVPSEETPNQNVWEWSYHEIAHLPKAEQQQWEAACQEELDMLQKRKVFDLVDCPKGRKVIKNHWVFNVKSDGWKNARLVAKGYSQVEGLDFDQIFSPVVCYETVHLMFTLAALANWYISALDVRSAYLYGELEEEIYMEQPEGFAVPGQEQKVLHLQHALYGLKQAGLAWWQTLDKSLKELGFDHLKSDAGLFLFKRKNIVITIIYVDDALFCGPTKAVVDEVKAHLMCAKATRSTLINAPTLTR